MSLLYLQSQSSISNKIMDRGRKQADFQCQSCQSTSKCGVDTGPGHQDLWAKISSSSGIICVNCPDPEDHCAREIWLCNGCGEQWYHKCPEHLRRRKGPESLAKEHKCKNANKRAKTQLLARTQGPSHFQCSECDFKSTRGRDFGQDHQNFWECIPEVLPTTVQESIAEVACPRCNARFLKCRHCEKIKCLTSEEAKAKVKSGKRSTRTMMHLHIESAHKDRVGTRSDNADRDVDVLAGANDDHPFAGANEDSSHFPDASENMIPSITDGMSHSLADANDVYRPPLQDEDDTSFGGGGNSDSQFGMELDEENFEDFQRLKNNAIVNYLVEDKVDYDAAVKYLKMFPVDLNNISCDDDLCADTEYFEPPAEEPSRGVRESHKRLNFHDLDMLDFRSPKEKAMHNSHAQRVCQNQLYFFQKHCHKLDCLEKSKNRAANQEEVTKDRYLSEKIQCEIGGLAGIFGRAQVGDREDRKVVATPEETRLGWFTLDFVVRITESCQERFTRFVNAAWNHFKMGGGNVETKARLPRTMNTLMRDFTRGAHSVLKNFVSPRVFELPCGHAGVSLKEVFLISAGHGAEHNYARKNGVRNEEGLNGTQAMSDLLEEIDERMKRAGADEKQRKETKIGYMIFWSDSYLNSFIKQKDNSVWVLTVTFCPPEDMKSSGRYTHVLAIGKSDSDHTAVINHYMGKAEELMSGFNCYFGDTNRIERVALGMLCWSADRPEQQFITNTRKEGNYGRVTGWATDVSEEFLPACKKCYKSMIEELLNLDDEDDNIETDYGCNNCCNWSFETNPVKSIDGVRTKLQNSIKPGKDYPKTYPENAPEGMPEGREAGLVFLPPVRLSSKWMSQAVRCGYYGVRLGNWTKAVLDEYFRTCNIKTSVVNDVFERAERDKKEQSGKPISQESLMADAIAAVPGILSFSDIFARFRFPNLPMHGLGHGMIPDVMDIVHSVFKKFLKLTAFIEFANPILIDIASFKLDYCKLKLLPKAAWIGENSMGYMRLMSYLYGMFLLNNHLGTSEEARITAVFLKCFINSFQAYVSLLMSKRPVHPKVLEGHMKLFMSSAHYLHKYHGNLNRKKNTDSAPGRRSQLRKGPKFMETLSEATLTRTAQKLDLNTEGGKPAILKRLTQKLSVANYIEKIQRLCEETTGVEWSDLGLAGKVTLLKDDLVKIIYERFLKQPDSPDIPDEEYATEWNGPAGLDKAERMCWARGNWVSFMANMIKQTSYLGQLDYIW